MTILILSFLLIVMAIVNLRNGMISSFKIGYYEQRLKNKGEDISHIENIGVIGIWKL